MGDAFSVPTFSVWFPVYLRNKFTGNGEQPFYNILNVYTEENEDAINIQSLTGESYCKFLTEHVIVLLEMFH